MAKCFTRGTVTVRRLWAALALAVAFTLFASVAMAGPPANNPGKPFAQLGNSIPVGCGQMEVGLSCTGSCVLQNGGQGVCQTDADYLVCECVPEPEPLENNPGKPFEQLEAKLDAIAADIAEIKRFLGLDDNGNGTPIGCGGIAAPGEFCSGTCPLPSGGSGECRSDYILGICACEPNGNSSPR